jgi:hypothetical protein
MRGKAVLFLSVVLAGIGAFLVWVGYNLVGSSEGPDPQLWLIVPGILLVVLALMLPLMLLVFRAPG